MCLRVFDIANILFLSLIKFLRELDVEDKSQDRAFGDAGPSSLPELEGSERR
jgi:hypothetical protein